MQEIFQINQPDLDFGIYRILNSRQNEIQQFLTRTLPNKIQTAFNGNFEQANSVYNHLYTFFSRYYDNGDFISQRRYKGDTYAIPYAGEEVMLHWANKDQYYTKSGENFSNYAFTLENGKKVQFRLVEADTAKDNRKDNDQTRVFALIEPRIQTATDENGDEIQTDILPFDIQGDLLTIRFEYKAVNKKEKQADYITQAVEKIQNFAISDEFQDIFKPMPTEKNKTRTLLEKYLTDYTAKNTADYFIHKNLGKFLNQELDFYIKNEVMNLDNIQDSTDFSHIEQNLQTIKTLKTVAKEIIAFLAQLEDFQKKLWLKKKFVAGCHYLLTLDHLTEEQVQQALDNPKQTAQWQALFNVDIRGQNATEICQNYPHLVVDTSLFEPKFQAEVLNELHDLDEKTNGLLIHSDNFQALNLLQERYKEQVKCIYIDPPYNTGEDGFPYKDNYKSSSWLSMFEDRLNPASRLLNSQGLLACHMDEHEHLGLEMLIKNCFGNGDLGKLIWDKRNPKGDSKGLGVQHEYVHFATNNLEHLKDENAFVRNKENAERMLNKAEQLVRKFGITDEARTEYKKWVAEQTNLSGGEKAYNNLDENGYVFQPVSMGWPNKKKAPDDYFIPLIHPVTRQECPVPDRGWRNPPETMKKLLSENMIVFGKDENSIPRRKYLLKDYLTENVSSLYYMGSSDDELFKNLDFSFENPKPIKAAQYLLSISARPENSLIMDYFGGSGTTAHAVINLNREDNGNRKYILVEQGEYFDTVLKPRVQKVIFAKEWKDGKPQVDNGAFGGVSQIVKVLKLESYEDTLNNLELRKPVQDLADMGLSETVQNDYLLHYMLDVESRESLLNTEHFAKPFDYQLNIATTSAGAYETKTIDLVETFNYLIGLRVSEINDKRENGLVTVQGTGASGENVLVIWRDCEKYDYDRLNDYLNRHKINPQESEFDVVYINGDHNVPTVFAGNDESVKMLKVRSIEAEFLQRMFE
ncbi:site-specific DNA-methyltransferase [Actinobacillus pleuropneumoniae]|uniref:site-specific DNA-methyltransferase n=1 Tax=Actinobacillus pleuropneumoniae TaxID=715 RepID=UPI001F20565D|nr:site-specific DNA-methyltransferase [Actinobacillus pleuropneumoniae]UKH16236.1 site-specific DNA-methyltransferase [Actinobacillus pleuropneumoniae]